MENHPTANIHNNFLQKQTIRFGIKYEDLLLLFCFMQQNFKYDLLILLENFNLTAFSFYSLFCSLNWTKPKPEKIFSNENVKY